MYEFTKTHEYPRILNIRSKMFSKIVFMSPEEEQYNSSAELLSARSKKVNWSVSFRRGKTKLIFDRLF